MTRPVRLVAAFRPFPQETGMPHHAVLAAGFDWMAAARMLAASARRAGLGALEILTDVDTVLPLPARRYVTHHRRLMLWSLEVAVAYLASPDFDVDTIWLDLDQLVFSDLTRWPAAGADLGVLARRLDPRDPGGFQILNGVQFWAVRAQARLLAFYRLALARAEHYGAAVIDWGADTRALEDLLAPIDPALGQVVAREGLQVHVIPADEVLERLSSAQVRQLRAGQPIGRSRAVLDFRNARKRYMRDAFAALLPGEAAC